MTDEKQPIIAVNPNGIVSIGRGYTLGQILDALELAQRAVRGIVLRPTSERAEQENVEKTM